MTTTFAALARSTIVFSAAAGCAKLIAPPLFTFGEWVIELVAETTPNSYSYRPERNRQSVVPSGREELETKLTPKHEHDACDCETFHNVLQ